MIDISYIPHRELDLREAGDSPAGDPHRPLVVVWPELNDEETKASISLTIGAMWGQNLRFVDLTPGEARTLSRILAIAANEVEAANADPQEKAS